MTTTRKQKRARRPAPAPHISPVPSETPVLRRKGLDSHSAEPAPAPSISPVLSGAKDLDTRHGAPSGPPCTLQPATCNPKPTTRNASTLARDPRTRLPAIQLIRALTGALPPKVLYDQVIAALGPNPSEDHVRPYYQAWCARGYNPRSLTWLLEWYVNGAAGTGGPPCPPTRYPQHGTRNQPRNAGPPASPDEFTRWQEYQTRVQNGEDPNEVKRQLGL